ncbi:Esterase B1 [Pseudolycoriella hygida]|uniref:carboxylesterase n=1 Tax=Pseudolycoriella hygida TaxID=35572 RepID=A0A9Q0RXC3_9DIPT|nr:Esterase B1 [Pseudolycoriella hygida]
MESNYIVQTEYGKVRGFLHSIPRDSLCCATNWQIKIQGLMYETIDIVHCNSISQLQSPLKPKPWGEEIIDAEKEQSPCAAKNSLTKTFIGSDDCLYLNIFTKNLNPEKLYGVMVYIHGGGHSSGSSTLDSYSPDYLLTTDVVIVTFNYRLGPLGFLTLKDETLNVPGNAGLKDQQLAMQFVKDNIQHFGGDPNNCTLFGHSSGATCVSLHCIVESSRGLFNKAIIMSGSPVASESLRTDDNFALKLAKKLGFDGENESDVLAFLEEANVLSMAEAQFSLIESDGSLYPPMPFGPCIEPYRSKDSFMLNAPIDLLKSAWSNSIDLMIGGTSSEGLCIQSQFDQNYESIIPSEIKTTVNDEKLKDFATRLKDFYSSLSSTDLEAYETFNGDQVRWMAMQRFIHSRQNIHNAGRTFFYRFSLDSPTQNHYRIRWFGPEKRGVAHADELCYIWKNGRGDVPHCDSIEFISIKRFTSVLTSFAITGDPNSNALDFETYSIVWEPVNTPPYKGLIIDKTLEFNVLEQSERLKLLESLYEESSVRLF